MIPMNDLIFAKRILLSNLSRPAFPFKLSFAVTYRCNLRCKMCNIWGKTDGIDELNVDEIDNFFEHAGGFSYVGITGGEPFLRNDLSEICDVITHRCSLLSWLNFTTNGQLTDRVIALARHLADKQKKLNCGFIVSIDGPPDLHSTIRGDKNAWNKALTTFIQLKAIPHIKARIGYTVSAHNMGSFEETFLMLQKMYPPFSFDDINVNIFQKSDFYYGNIEMDALDTDRILRQIKDIRAMDKDRSSINNFLRRSYMKLYPEYLRTGRSPVKCQALSSSCFLGPEGDLYPCSVYNKPLLNVRDMKQDLSVLWNSEAAKKVAGECSRGDCPGCWSPCDAFTSIGGSLIKVITGKGAF